MSRRSLQEGKYAMCAFCAEEAFQFELKYFIGSRLGDFPKTHGLIVLLQESSKLCPALQEFSEKNTTAISHLEDAYIMSRYYDKEYREEEVKEMLNLYDELASKLGECPK